MTQSPPEPNPNAPFALHDAYVARFGERRVIEAIRPFLTAARIARIDAMLDGRLGSVQAAIERPQDPHNAAAVVRSAEAFGCTDVHVVAAEPGALNVRGTTQGAFHWVDTHHWASMDELVEKLPRPPVRLFGAVMGGEHTPGSLPVDRPLCVLLGNETDGLSTSALAHCDGTVRIEMFGMSESLNLSVSAAILLHRLCERRREHLGQSGDLEPARRHHQRARAYARSVDLRLLEGALTG